MRRAWTLLLLALPLGCLEEPAYQCQTDEVCFYKGFGGVCDLATSSCAYQSVDCQGLSSIEGWVNARGLCVPAPNNSEPSSTTGDTGGGITSGSTSSVGSSPPTTNDPTEDAGSSQGIVTGPESSSGSAESESSASGQTSSGSEVGCEGLTDNITDQGSVTASTTFNGDFLPSESVDGSAATSWFSSGPEGGGGPSIYSWSTVTDRCINRIEVDDNSGHSDPDFRSGYGFATATVRVLQDDLVVFEEAVPLPGTPDGPFTVETGGMLGSRVLIQLDGHENDSCGGFSELRVIGGPAQD